MPGMQRIAPDRPHPLFDTAATRRLEASAAAALAPHTLMQRAGQATARLALALAPHARTFWFACGGGNNGGDGLEAALLLHRGGHPVVVTWLGTPETAPADARQSWQRAHEAGVPFAAEPPFLGPQDLCVDALLGIGLRADPRPRRPDARLLQWLARMHACAAPTLCVDLPSGLVAESGQYIPGLAPAQPGATAARHTLSLLTLKPGLFTGQGRDAAGSVWFDDLGVPASTETPCAWLAGPPASAVRAHASHKGSYGDVAVIGGEGLQARGMGMTGAALLAASAALHAGAGRVMVALLDAGALPALPQQPELMLRRCDALALDHATVVCGCGGGAAVAAVLPDVLQQSTRLVLDADALNQLAKAPELLTQLHENVILTPHAAEMSRLCGEPISAVLADPIGIAQTYAKKWNCVVLLKGATTCISNGRETRLNTTGNAGLAKGGSGDVLAGLITGLLAQGLSPLDAASCGAYVLGASADTALDLLKERMLLARDVVSAIEQTIDGF